MASRCPLRLFPGRLHQLLYFCISEVLARPRVGVRSPSRRPARLNCPINSGRLDRREVRFCHGFCCFCLALSHKCLLLGQRARPRKATNTERNRPWRQACRRLASGHQHQKAAIHGAFPGVGRNHRPSMRFGIAACVQARSAALSANRVAAIASIPPQDHLMLANGLPADTNNGHCRDRPQHGAGKRGPMRSRGRRGS